MACVRALSLRTLMPTMTFEGVWATSLRLRQVGFVLMRSPFIRILLLYDVHVDGGNHAFAMQAAADEILAKHGADVPVAVIGEEPNEGNIAHALHALQVRNVWTWQLQWSHLRVRRNLQAPLSGAFTFTST